MSAFVNLLPDFDPIIAQFLPITEAEQIGLPVSDEMLISLVGPTPLTVDDFKRLSTDLEGLNVIRASLLLDEIPPEFNSNAELYRMLPPDINDMIIKQLTPLYTMYMVNELSTINYVLSDDRKFLNTKNINRIVKYQVKKNTFKKPSSFLMEAALKTTAKYAAKHIVRSFTQLFDKDAVIYVELIFKNINDDTLLDLVLTELLKLDIEASYAVFEVVSRLWYFNHIKSPHNIIAHLLNNPLFDPDQIMTYLDGLTPTVSSLPIYEIIASNPELKSRVNWNLLVRRARRNTYDKTGLIFFQEMRDEANPKLAHVCKLKSR